MVGVGCCCGGLLFSMIAGPFSTAVCHVTFRPMQSLERIFPNGLDMALIVDDRDDVWRGEQAKNLLLVRPYKFFVVSGCMW